MRNRIWTELTQAKHNEEFANAYAEQQRTILRWFNIGILIFSTGGIMGWTIWNKFPLIACVIISLVSLIRLIQPHIIMTDKQISNLDNISNFYFSYYNKLERLWYDNDHGSINNETLKKRFFLIKETESSIAILVNDTMRTKPTYLIKKADLLTRNYLKKTFNV